MGNRHGGEKASREEKEEKKRKKKEKKAKKKAKKKGGAAGSDVDLDPESSQFSCADSESLAFHSAENLSPYLDASTRSEEGAACVGFYDNGHILSSKDFHDGFSIEACLPADLAASALMCDLASDVSKGGEDVTSMASGVYSTPLLSSPDVRRGIPRSPLAQRQKDSFVEPVPPIPSDFSSNTLSSVSYQEGVSTPGTQRSSSRASSSTVDTNAAHCIERLEELERNIERTIIERFAPLEPSANSGSENTTPRLIRRAEFLPEDRSREGSMTPRGIASDGGLAQSPETSPPIIRKIWEPCRPTAREGSCTPVGVIHGVWSQSAENSPVIVRRALPNPESPIILRRTPSQSPSVERKFPANALESPVFYRRTVTNTESSGLSPSTQRRPPPESQERSPQLIRRAAPELESSRSGSPQKSKVPPPVPPKPIMKTLTSPEIARRLQNMPKSPIMARKVYAFQEQQQTKEKNAALKDDPWDRSWREHQMPPKSPSRSPEVRHRVTRKTPSSSPSPKSLVRKLIPPEDRAPPPGNTPPPCPQSQVQFCQQHKGIPVKHCTVSTQPSAAVVLDMRAPTSQPAESKPSQAPPPSRDTPSDKSSAVSEDSIKKSTATAVFGSVSPKLKRQKKIQSGDDSSQSSCYDPQRGDSTDSSTRSPPCSPPVQRGRPVLDRTVVKDSEGSDHSPTRGPLDTGGQSPGRSRAQLQKQDSKCGTDDGALSADIAGGLTYHAYLHDDTATHPLRDRVGEHLDNVHHYHKTTHQDPESAVQTQTVHTDRSQIEGHSDFQTGSFSPSTHPYPHPTTTPPQFVSPPTDKAISQSAVIAGSTPHPSPALDTTAIRRIDIDVNVVLPEGGYHEGGTLFPPAGQSGSQWETGGGQGMTEAGMMDAGMNPDPDNAHSSHAEKTGTAAKTCLAENQDKTEAGSSRKAESSVLPPPPPPPSTTTTTEDRPKPQPPPVREVARGSSEGNVPRIETVKNASSYKKGEQPSQEVMSDVAPPASLPISAPGSQSVSGEREGEGESVGGGVGLASERKSSTEGLLRQEGKPTRVNTDSAQPCVSGSEPASGQESKPAPSSHHPELSNTMQADEAQQDPHPAADEAQQDPHPARSQLKNVHQSTTDTQAAENILQDNVPPPSPTAMDVLAEEEEGEEDVEEVNSMINAHHDSDISSKISQEMQMFGETVVKRLSSFLESQASESDSCLEESHSDLLTVPGSRHKKPDEDPNGKVSSSMAEQQTVSRTDQTEAGAGLNTAGVVPKSVKESSHKVKDPPVESSKEDIEPVLREELNTFATSDLPGERLVTSDTTETLSTDHDTSASSKRESTTSTATDETLTSFKTRSTTDSAEFEDAFILPESLVFVRSVSEGVEGGAGAMVETGRIIKRPPIPAELTRHSAAAQEPSPHKPRKKRRRQVGTYDVSARADVTEPEPKRGSKQIQEVIDAYCEGTSDDSDISSSADDILSGEVVRRATFTRSEHQPRLPTSADREQKARDTVRKPQTSADRDTDSSDESTELEAKRQSSSSHDSSLRIPEIEETFGELMGVKTLLEDLEDKPPTTSEAPPVQAEEEEEKIHAKEFLPSAQHRRRSKTSPARTDRTESDLDVSEHRDDASTDSMYADDEDEGNEVVFQRSYSEEHGGEVVLSCTIYNSSRDNGADSDEFWADAEAAAAADESYKSLETAADAAGSAFQNARIQMHDIHQHLQDLRRQMEMLQDDITSTSLTLTPDFSLESEQRPVTE
ncbi:hypothetical protein ACOMHN_061938 [Nucella lapillus]